MKELSICIPTYNRSSYLRLLLESIIREESSLKIDICINDNASTDGTEKVVEEFAAKNPGLSIIYNKNSDNVLSYNYVNVIELAKTPYVWIIGDDDRLRTGAIDRALEAICGEPDIITTNYEMFDSTMSVDLGMVRIVKDNIKDRTFDFNVRENFKLYVENALSRDCVGSLLSNIIFKKEHWEDENKKEVFWELLYSEGPQMYMHITTMINGCTLRHVSTPLIDYRRDNVVENYSERANNRHFLGAQAEGQAKVIKRAVKDEKMCTLLLDLLRRDLAVFMFCGYRITQEERTFIDEFYAYEDVRLFDKLNIMPDKIDISQTIVLFGASNNAAKVIKRIEKFDFFCDNNKDKWGGDYLGKKIISPKQLTDMCKKQDVLVLISSMYVKEIYSQLNGLGITNVRHISAF